MAPLPLTGSVLTSAAMYSGERPKRSHLSTSAPALIM